MHVASCFHKVHYVFNVVCNGMLYISVDNHILVGMKQSVYIEMPSLYLILSVTVVGIGRFVYLKGSSLNVIVLFIYVCVPAVMELVLLVYAHLWSGGA